MKAALLFLASTLSGMGVGLQWDPSQTSGVTYYIYAGKDPSFTNNLSTAIRQSCGTNTQTLINTDGRLTYFVATAVNGQGYESIMSNMVSAGTNDSTMVPPSNLRGDSLNKRKATLTWQPSPSTRVNQYKVNQWGTGTGSSRAYYTSNTRSYTVTGLSSRKTYWFSVQAVDTRTGDESAESNAVNVKVR